MPPPPVRFAAIGLNHPHVYSQVGTLLLAGGEFSAFHEPDAGLASGFARAFSQAKQVEDVREILEDPSIELVTSAAIPGDRAALAVSAMQHGKDFLADKPGVVSFEQLDAVRRAQRETGRRYCVFFSERLESRATLRALGLVHDGVIGRVVHVIGMGPHRLGLSLRPPWFFDPARAGGILCDLASHQIDQFLHFSGEESAELVSSLVANRAHPEHPQLEDYGEVHLRTPDATGLLRVDWFTPDGLSTWGDGRLFVVGTEGTIEVRKYCDLGGRSGGDHLLLVDSRETRRIDCRHVELPFGRQLLADVRERSESAMTHAHCFAVCELALRAQAEAVRHGNLRPAVPPR